MRPWSEVSSTLCARSPILWIRTATLDTYLDDLSGRALDPTKVGEARTTECEFIDTMGVWERIPRPAPNSGIRVLKGRWVDVNKGDEQLPNHRS